MDSEQMIAAIDAWGRLRWDNGYKAAAAHAAPDDMEAGRTTLAAESLADESRLVWAPDLVDTCEDNPLVSEADHMEVFKLIDMWGHSLWDLGWRGAPADDPTAKDTEFWRDSIAPSRVVWVETIRALYFPPPPF